MATPPPSHRTKASAIRKKLAAGQNVPESDQIWLGEYEEATNGSGNFGASKSSKTVHRSETIVEDKAAVGTGAAAATAAGLALVAKEEGRRIDSLTVNAIAALKEAVDVYKSVAVTLLERTKVLEETHVSMLEAFRGEFLDRVDAEAELREKERESQPNEANAMLLAVVAKHMGIDVSTLTGAAPSGKNGAAKKPQPKA